MNAKAVEVHLSVPEVRKRLGVHKMTVYRWISTGLLPAVRLGPRMLRIPESALSKFLSGKRVRAGVFPSEVGA